MSPRIHLAIAFRIAQEYLWDGKGRRRDMGIEKSEGICAAIHKARLQKRIGGEACNDATDIISDRLGDEVWAASWLHNVAGIKHKDLKKVRVQAWRLAWLKALEKEFSK